MNNFIREVLSRSAMAFCCLLSFTPAATAFTLDAFSDTNSNQGFNVQGVSINSFTPFPDTDTDTNLPSISVAGGNRHMNVSSSGSSLVVVENGELDFTTGNDFAATTTIVWNGSSNVNFSNLNADANLDLDLQKDGDGDDSLFVRINFADETFLDSNDNDMGFLDITLYDGTDDGATTYTVRRDIDPVSIGSGGQSLQYQFSEYSSNGININSVDYVALTINGLPASDVDLEFFATEDVPFEFSPVIGLLLAGGFFGSMRIRKKLSR